MYRRRLAVSMVVVALACASWPGAAWAADPFVLFLLRMLRDQAVSSAIESGTAPAPPQGRQPPPAAGTLVVPSSEADRLRRLIDESFIHLAPAQRQELHASLVKILDDPKNASQRAEILAAFAARAEASRQAHVQLSRLSEDEMRGVAAGAREEFARLPPDQRQLLLQALEQGVPGMPRTLQEAILAEFRSVR